MDESLTESLDSLVFGNPIEDSEPDEEVMGSVFEPFGSGIGENVDEPRAGRVESLVFGSQAEDSGLDREPKGIVFTVETLGSQLGFRSGPLDNGNPKEPSAYLSNGITETAGRLISSVKRHEYNGKHCCSLSSTATVTIAPIRI